MIKSLLVFVILGLSINSQAQTARQQETMHRLDRKVERIVVHKKYILNYPELAEIRSSFKHLPLNLKSFYEGNCLDGIANVKQLRGSSEITRKVSKTCSLVQDKLMVDGTKKAEEAAVIRGELHELFHNPAATDGEKERIRFLLSQLFPASSVVGTVDQSSQENQRSLGAK